MYEAKFIGNLYEQNKNKDIAEIAKLVRKEIKEKFPQIKTSVRIERYSGGRSLNVKIKSVPFKIMGGIDYRGNQQYNEKANEVLRGIEAICDQYRMDASDPMIDYFNTNFYLHVGFEYDLERAELNELKGASA